MLARYLTSSVPQATRAKGSATSAWAPWWQSAAANGPRTPWCGGAATTASRSPATATAFRASCDCPYFTDRAEICKHIWAAIIEADERALLAGDGSGHQELFLEADFSRADDPQAAQRADAPAEGAAAGRGSGS